jgi:TolB protein
MKKWIFLLSIIISPLMAHEEIEVVLNTQSSLMPVYVTPLKTSNHAFSNEFENQIMEVLKFDLSHNGYFQVAQQNERVNQTLDKVSTSLPRSFWKEYHYNFVIKVSMQNMHFSLSLYDAENNTVKTLTTELIGNLSEDRKKIHTLSDVALDKLLHKKGIASLPVIYSVRKANPDKKGPEWLSEIWVSDYDGENAKQITNENNYAVHPLFFPSQNNLMKNFLYVSYKTGMPKIYYSSFTQKKSTPIIALRGNQMLPALSQTGDKIAFICDAAGRADLFVQRFDEKGFSIGKPRQVFAYPRATQASPTFSPDGDKIAFVSDKDGSPRIYIINTPLDADVTRPDAQLLTKKNRENVTPNWSKDGKKIAFCARVEGVRQIWVCDLEKNEEWQLTTGPGNKENPIWAPDSLHLIYNTEDDKSSEVYLININQKEAYQITSGFGKKRFPSWGQL